MKERSHVMMGSLSNFTITDVLDVVGLSRQHTLVELRDHDGSNVASINLKGGHLVQGSSHENDPRESLRRALQAPARCTFHVYRLADAASYSSFGELDALIASDLSSPVQTPVAHGPAMVPPDVRKEEPPRQASVSALTPVAAASPSQSGVSLAVASPKGGVGKTTIALNLGISLAHQGFRVITIDADVNGDLLSLINARGSAALGAYDLLLELKPLELALRRTVVNGLRVLPAVGRELPPSALFAVDCTARWRALISEAMSIADVVLVDCPAGMSHATLEILQGVTHVLGVFQAEAVASRSFEMFERGLAALPDRVRPRIAGVVVNMLREDAASRGLYDALIAADTSQRVVKTVINRSDAFEDATGTGIPVRLHGSRESRQTAAVFDDLAAEIAVRLRLFQPQLQAGGFLM